MPICYPEHKSKKHDDKKALKLIFESLFFVDLWRFFGVVVDEPEACRTQKQNEDDGRNGDVQPEAIDGQCIGADQFEQFVVDLGFAVLKHGRCRATGWEILRRSACAQSMDTTRIR